MGTPWCTHLHTLPHALLHITLSTPSWTPLCAPLYALLCVAMHAPLMPPHPIHPFAFPSTQPKLHKIQIFFPPPLIFFKSLHAARIDQLTDSEWASNTFLLLVKIICHAVIVGNNEKWNIYLRSVNHFADSNIKYITKKIIDINHKFNFSSKRRNHTFYNSNLPLEQLYHLFLQLPTWTLLRPDRLWLWTLSWRIRLQGPNDSRKVPQALVGTSLLISLKIHTK